MQNTSIIQNYNAIMASGNYMVETKVTINNVDYFEDTIYSIKTFRAVFDEQMLTIGNAYSGRIELSMILPAEEIPKAAEIKLFIRLKNDMLVSDWLPKGVFYIYQREVDPETGTLDIIGYDALFRANRSYPSSSLAWGNNSPRARAVLDEIAGHIGVQLDNRTKSAIPASSQYIVAFPAQYSMRDVLGSIAAMYCGNFCMSDDGKLLLVGAVDLPTETYYLINELGDYITVGGLRILI